MKTFFAILAAILVAAILISGGVCAKSNIDQWERAKQICYAQINAENTGAVLAAKRFAERTHTDAAFAQSQADILRMVSQNSENIVELDKSKDRIIEMDRLLLQLLENKPFGIPLTAQERSELETIKAELAQNEY